MKTLLIVVSSILGLLVLSLILPGTRPANARPPGEELLVQITNPTVPVTLPAQQGFNVSCFTGDIDPVSGQAQCSLLTIPAGRSVVLETISCQAVLAAGQGPADVQLIVPNTPLAHDHAAARVRQRAGCWFSRRLRLLQGQSRAAAPKHDLHTLGLPGRTVDRRIAARCISVRKEPR